jgi:alkylation response protein AidB-like acyl-CoA dehydrogenase
MAALTEEQSMLKDQASAWVVEQAPVAKFRAMRDSGNELGFEAPTWSAMVDMGWTGILVPEAYGGSDLGYLTFGVVLEQLGRQLTASPLFASALVGASALMLGGSESQKHSYLPRIVDGSEILTLAVDETPRHAPSAVALRAQQSAGGYKLTGSKTFVVEGMSATTFVVAARSDSGALSLFLVPAAAAGVSRERLSTMDSRGYARVEFAGVEVGADALLGDAEQGGALLDAVLDAARAGLGAEMMGTASQAFDMTLEYLKTREQFGRVIGSFQALGHRAAELFTAMELARSCAEAALQALDAGAPNVAELCSLSKARVGDFLHTMSNQLIQIHGGIGMTDEFDAGFYLKRARVLESLYGNQAFHRDRYARLLGF